MRKNPEKIRITERNDVVIGTIQGETNMIFVKKTIN